MFKTGQSVRCIDGSGLSAHEAPPLTGEIFTIRALDNANGRIAVNRPNYSIHGFFNASRFQDATIEWVPEKPLAPPVVEPFQVFDGSDYKADLDHDRLVNKHKRIFDVMKDGKPRSLMDIERDTGIASFSVSTHLRNLRKVRFGGHTVTKTRSAPKSGTWLYTLIENKDAAGSVH